MLQQRARRGERVGAARADREDALLGRDQVAGAGDQERASSCRPRSAAPRAGAASCRCASPWRARSPSARGCRGAPRASSRSARRARRRRPRSRRSPRAPRRPSSRRILAAVCFMTVVPSVTCPSEAIATLPPWRTQRTVVECHSFGPSAQTRIPQARRTTASAAALPSAFIAGLDDRVLLPLGRAAADRRRRRPARRPGPRSSSRRGPRSRGPSTRASSRRRASPPPRPRSPCRPSSRRRSARSGARGTSARAPRRPKPCPSSTSSATGSRSYTGGTRRFPSRVDRVVVARAPLALQERRQDVRVVAAAVAAHVEQEALDLAPAGELAARPARSRCGRAACPRRRAPSPRSCPRGARSRRPCRPCGSRARSSRRARRPAPRPCARSRSSARRTVAALPGRPATNVPGAPSKTKKRSRKLTRSRAVRSAVHLEDAVADLHARRARRSCPAARP